jgi:hypothetical protein
MKWRGAPGNIQKTKRSDKTFQQGLVRPKETGRKIRQLWRREPLTSTKAPYTLPQTLT